MKSLVLYSILGVLGFVTLLIFITVLGANI